MTASERIRRAGAVAWALVGLSVLVAILGYLAWFVRVVFPPLLLAGAIVFLLNPVVTMLQARGVPRAAGAALSYLVVLLLLFSAGFGLWPLATAQVDELTGDWPAIRGRVERFVDERARESTGTFFEFTRKDIENAVSTSGVTFEEQLQRLRRIGAEVFHVLLILVLGPIIAFYLLVDIPHLRRVADALIPPPARADVVTIARRLNRAIGGFFRGQLMVALIVGILCSIGLGAIQLRFWFLIGMIAGLFNIIPLIGPWVGGIPGVTIALTTGSPLKALGVVIVMVAVQQIDNHLITPQVMQRAVQLHPAVVMLALVAGGSLGGFAGLLLAVPTAAALKIVLGHLWHVHVLGQPIAPDDEGHGIVEQVEDRPENLGADEGDRAAPDGASEVGSEVAPASGTTGH